MIELKQMGPTESYNEEALAKVIDNMIMGLNMCLKKGELTVESLDKKDNLIWTLSQMLWKCLISLDSVLLIVDQNQQRKIIPIY